MKYYANLNNIDFISPRAGYTLATEITCVPPKDDVYFTQADAIVWYFGDGEKYTSLAAHGLSAKHIYKLPGTYNLSAIAYTDYPNSVQNETAVATLSCKVQNFIDNAISFITVPPPTLPGFFTQYPYKVIWSVSDPNIIPNIDLYSQFSRSYPPQDNLNKWSFVRPEWRFTDLSGKPIKNIYPEYTTIKINSNGSADTDGVAVGLTGVAEFYFIDDIYSVDMFIHDAPSPIVWATIQTSAINYYLDSDIKSGNVPSYSTTEVRAYAPHVSYWRAPDFLKITENGVRDFVNPRWSSASIPFFISAQIDPNQVKKINQYRPDITFAKFMPYAVSAQGMDYVECAEDIPVYVTVINSTSATFYNETVPFAINNFGEYTFNQTDKYKFVAPGFAKDEVKIFDEKVVQLSAKAIIDFNKLNLPVNSLIYNPYVWVPNPVAGTITMVYYTGGLNEHFAKALKSQFTTHSRKNIFTPVVNNLTTTSNGLTGFNGVYAVAVSPGNEPDFEYYTWVADADLDYLYKYDTLAQMVLSADLKTITGLDKVSPANICIDHNKELWVTCYDTLSVLKFDINGNLLFGINVSDHIPLVNPNMPGMFDISPAISIFDDVKVIEPTCIDTDTQNNVWVSYSSPISSYLVKYSSSGSYITSLNLPTNSTPQDILIDKDDSFWVAECHEVYGDTGVLKKYDTLGNLLSAFNNIPNLGYLTYDIDGNPWFTYDYNKVGKIKNDVFTHVAAVTSSYGFTNLNIPPQTGPTGYIESVALEGIACTHKNLIFVVHSIENKIYIYNTINDKHVDTINIKPDLMLGIYNDPLSFKHHEEQWQKSIQIIGDWTGIRWSRKYKSFYFETKTISGTSIPLNVKKLNNQEIRKKNQDFNMSEQIASFALSPLLRDNKFLFDTFLPAIYGDSTNIDDTGTVFYEKISNFLANHNDIDTCEIDNIYKLADMLDITIDDFRLSFPFQIEQIINILTISHSKLWGARQSNITDASKLRGTKLDYNTYNVKEGIPIIIYDKPNNSYSYLYPPSVEGHTTYSLLHLTAVGLIPPLGINYEFYSYIPSLNTELKDGVIDWNNPLTTLDPTLSTYNDWVKDSGIIDNILNYYLYKGLKLI